MKNFLTLILICISLTLGALIPSSLGYSSTESLLIVSVLAVATGIFSKSTKRKLSLVTVCGAISGNLLYDCENPMQSGTRDRAVIINKEDIDSVVYDLVNPMIVTDIVMKLGKTAFQVDGINNSIMPKATMIQLTFSKVYDHIVKMIGFDISPEAKLNFEGIKNGSFVVITENVFRGATGNSAFEIYGISTGLELTILEKDANNQDTQGGFDFTFATNKNKEPKLPLSLFSVSYAGSKAVVDSLL